jgi:hypothetical protein
MMLGWMKRLAKLFVPIRVRNRVREALARTLRKEAAIAVSHVVPGMINKLNERTDSLFAVMEWRLARLETACAEEIIKQIDARVEELKNLLEAATSDSPTLKFPQSAAPKSNAAA